MAQVSLPGPSLVCLEKNSQVEYPTYWCFSTAVLVSLALKALSPN